MATTATVWVRLRDVGKTADELAKIQPGVLPLILRKRSSVASEEEDFVFPYSPREMNVGQLADEMVQIARPGTTPIVAFKSHRLMTLDFTALIVHPGDGLYRSVEKEIAILRKFASSSDKVFQLINYDGFTKNPFVFRNMSEEKISGLFFSITDMSVEVGRRNRENLITSANVKFSLVENRNPRINLALIPPIVLKKVPDDCKKPAYAKKHPEICNPQPDETRSIFSSSQRSDANALWRKKHGEKSVVDANHRKSYKLCWLPLLKRAEWKPMNTSPCLGPP